MGHCTQRLNIIWRLAKTEDSTASISLYIPRVCGRIRWRRTESKYWVDSEPSD